MSETRNDARAKDGLSARTPKHSLSPTRSRLEQQEGEHTHVSCGGKKKSVSKPRPNRDGPGRSVGFADARASRCASAKSRKGDVQKDI